MNMITVKQAAEKWKVTPRRVQGLCKEGKIKGAVRWERTWMIPADAVYPKAGDTAIQIEGKTIPRKCPSLMMTDLYRTPGTADEVIRSLEDNPQAAAIFAAEIAYNRFEFERVNEYAQILLKQHSEFHTTVAAGVQLGLCAAYSGNLQLFMKARQYVFEAPCENDHDRDIVNFWLCVLDFITGDIDLPEWFQKGRFENISSEHYPAVKFQYAKFQWITIRKMILNKDPQMKERGKILLEALPNMLEPMIAQAVVDRTLLVEIGLRVVCAIVYHDTGRDEDAVYHLDKALTLAIPDRLYATFVECGAMLDTLLYERLSMIAPDSLAIVKSYEKKMIEAQRKLHQGLNMQKHYGLSVREREAAKLATFGMSNDQIAVRMHISENSVRSLLSMAMNKTGAQNRKELGSYL